MAVNDITFFEPTSAHTIGSRRYLVIKGATTINPGEPVVLGSTLPYPYVAAAANSTPALKTDYLVGIAQSTSTQTSSANGVVDVIPAVQGIVYLIKPKTASTYGLTAGSLSQTTYNTQVGNRVLFDLTSSTYTIAASDSALNGLLVEYVDVNTSGGKVAFSVRNQATLYGAPGS